MKKWSAAKKWGVGVSVVLASAATFAATAYQLTAQNKKAEALLNFPARILENGQRLGKSSVTYRSFQSTSPQIVHSQQSYYVIHAPQGRLTIAVDVTSSDGSRQLYLCPYRAEKNSLIEDIGAPMRHIDIRGNRVAQTNLQDGFITRTTVDVGEGTLLHPHRITQDTPDAFEAERQLNAMEIYCAIGLELNRQRKIHDLGL